MSELRSRVHRVLLILLIVAAAPAMWVPAAHAGTANGGLPGASHSNPLAGMHWGHYTGTTDNVYPSYQAATGRDRKLLAKIALRPLIYWFGAWNPDNQAGAIARQYIAQDTGGDPNELAQLAVFRLDPWEQPACSHTPGPAAQDSYRRWIDNFADGIGSSRVALILQPDLPFALCSPAPWVPLSLVAYAAARFGALPHTTVYIDVGALYWASPKQAASLLDRAGIRGVRGFALNATQYDSTGNELEFGARIERRLRARGIRGKHFVVNTAENGAPFLYDQYHGDHANPRVCRNRHDTICATLGIPPTWQVANPRWRLSRKDRRIASRYADAYLWIGRPWLVNGDWPFDLQRALGLAASTPY